MANFASVRTAYYKHDTAGKTKRGKKLPSALTQLDHVLQNRDGATASRNVFGEHTVSNKGFYYHGCNSAAEAYEKARKAHQKLTGKKPRSDMNTMFETVIILSEPQYAEIEKTIGAGNAASDVLLYAKRYCKSIQDEFGFMPLGIDAHYDEGHYDKETGEFKRNIHIHCQFYNYDFNKRVSPLRKLMVRGKEENGQTKELNPNFVKMQDMVADIYKPLGFRRGISKAITGKDHQNKQDFVRDLTDKKLDQVQQQITELKHAVSDLERVREELKGMTREELNYALEQLDEQDYRPTMRRH